MLTVNESRPKASRHQNHGLLQPVLRSRKFSSRFRFLKRFIFLILLTTLLASAFAPNANARRRRRHSRKKHAAIINEKKLYERLGSGKVVAGIVDEWIRLSLSDARISSSFANLVAHPEQLAKYRRRLNDQLCEVADGPCHYNGTEMKKAHEGLKIKDEQFVAFAEDLDKALDKHAVAEREKNELLGRLGTMRGEIVAGANANKPTDHAF